jgi:hypothetical protein
MRITVSKNETMRIYGRNVHKLELDINGKSAGQVSGFI